MSELFSNITPNQILSVVFYFGAVVAVVLSLMKSIVTMQDIRKTIKNPYAEQEQLFEQDTDSLIEMTKQHSQVSESVKVSAIKSVNKDIDERFSELQQNIAGSIIKTGKDLSSFSALHYFSRICVPVGAIVTGVSVGLTVSNNSNLQAIVLPASVIVAVFSVLDGIFRPSEKKTMLTKKKISLEKILRDCVADKTFYDGQIAYIKLQVKILDPLKKNYIEKTHGYYEEALAIEEAFIKTIKDYNKKHSDILSEYEANS